MVRSVAPISPSPLPVPTGRRSILRLILPLEHSMLRSGHRQCCLVSAKLTPRYATSVFRSSVAAFRPAMPRLRRLLLHQGSIKAADERRDQDHQQLASAISTRVESFRKSPGRESQTPAIQLPVDESVDRDVQESEGTLPRCLTSRHVHGVTARWQLRELAPRYSLIRTGIPSLDNLRDCHPQIHCPACHRVQSFDVPRFAAPYLATIHWGFQVFSQGLRSGFHSTVFQSSHLAPSR